MSYVKRFNKMTWSFSRIHLWESCPYAFYLKYIEEDEGVDNFYSENGKAMHLTFEKLIKKEITVSEAPEFYDKQFSLICSTVRESTMQSTYDKCIDYLCEVDEFDYNRYEVIGVEEKLNFKIDKYKFVGYADVLIKDKTKGEVILVDHKSLDHLFKKDGTVLKNHAASFEAYKHQMYVYCEGIKQKYGFIPDKIVWHHFKDKGQLSVIQYDENEHKETINWVKATITNIYKDKSFNENKSYMQCYQLCNFRESCEYLDEED